MIRWQVPSRKTWIPKLTIGLLAKIGITAILASAAIKSAPVLVYNASRSVPLGFYQVEPTGRLKIGDLILLHTPEAVRAMAEARRYLPRTVPMIKRVAALEGDVVCARSRMIFINGDWRAERQSVDPSGRILPAWEGCHTLEAGEMFLLNPDVPDSFDGRYFGVVSQTLTIGKLRPL